MLLRSSSAPIPTSWLPNSMESSSPEPELTRHLPRTVAANPRQNFAETELQWPSKTEKRNWVAARCSSSSNLLKTQQSTIEEEPQQKFHKKATPSVRELFSTCGLDKRVLDHEEGKKVGKLQTLVMGDGMGSDGGRICGGRNGSGWESNHGRDETDAYYQNMIEANPNNALLLANYAKFLKEVRGNYPKAEEYVERAILANPGDADALSLYADLIWQTEKNAERAEDYFDRAVKSDPDDCYVLASYAKFLWDVEEDQDKTDETHTYPPDLCQGSNGHLRPALMLQQPLNLTSVSE